MSEKPRSKASYAKPLALTPFKASIPLNNQYSALASPSKSYAQATQKWSPPSPSISAEQSFRPNPQVRPIKPITSPYLKKTCSFTDKLLEKDEIDADGTPQLLRIFPSEKGTITQYFLPRGYENPAKTQEYYEFILVDSDSAEITHTKERNSEKVAYSKCKILKFITKEEWGNPFKTRTFSQEYQPSQYDYYDYQEAWYNALFYRPQDHSWFFSFCHRFNKKTPSWTYQWWNYFGLNKEILPEEIQKAWNYFQDKIKKVPYGNKLIMFAAEFQIPWIIGWDFDISRSLDHHHPPILEKKFRIKWWRTFDPGDRLSPANIDRWLITFDKLGQFPTPIRTEPSTSKRPLSKKERKKKLLEEISQLGDSDEEDISSSQPIPIIYEQFAQDPYEDYDLI